MKWDLILIKNWTPSWIHTSSSTTVIHWPHAIRSSHAIHSSHVIHGIDLTSQAARKPPKSNEKNIKKTSKFIKKEASSRYHWKRENTHIHGKTWVLTAVFRKKASHEDTMSQPSERYKITSTNHWKFPLECIRNASHAGLSSMWQISKTLIFLGKWGSAANAMQSSSWSNEVRMHSSGNFQWLVGVFLYHFSFPP